MAAKTAKPDQAAKPVKKAKLRYVRSDWTFDWKRPEATPISTWVAFLLVGGVFAFALMSLRVKMVEPVEWASPQASVIHLSGEGWSHALVEEARAKGPFPSRFDPDAWEGNAASNQVMAAAAEPRLKAHQPRLLPFPEPGIEPSALARRGEPVLPHRSLKADGPRAVEGLRLLPVLTAIDGIKISELPKELPAWNEPVTEVLASRPWKFLIELERSGRVRDCVSLAGGNELNPKELTAWLRAVTFPAKPREEGRRWVAISVEFQNQTN